jgi:nucleotide-binding universal stress UspA family protein
MTAAAGTIEPSAEDLVVREWVTGLESDIRQALRTDHRAPTTGAELVVGQGGTWADGLTALPWASGEVLAVGTSSSTVSRFFLGSHASKIVRNSPVPV